MRRSYIFKPVALRFRRWSRKRYAAFISVQRAVTIGRLTSNIIDRFQKKNLSLHTGIHMLLNGAFGTDEEECAEASGSETGLFVSDWQLLYLLPALVSNEVAHPAGCTSIKYKMRGGMYLRVRSTSFFILFFRQKNKRTYILLSKKKCLQSERIKRPTYRLTVSLPLLRGGRGCVTESIFLKQKLITTQ